MSCRQQSGFGLIELMISMTIGLFLIAGMGSLFMTAKSGKAIADNNMEYQRIFSVFQIFAGNLVRQAGFGGKAMDDLRRRVVFPETDLFSKGVYFSGVRKSSMERYRKVVMAKTLGIPFKKYQDTLSFRFWGGDTQMVCDAASTDHRLYEVTLWVDKNGFLQCGYDDGKNVSRVIGERSQNPNRGVKVLSFEVGVVSDEDDDGDADMIKSISGVSGGLNEKVMGLKISMLVQVGRTAPRSFTQFVALKN